MGGCTLHNPVLCCAATVLINILFLYSILCYAITLQILETTLNESGGVHWVHLINQNMNDYSSICRLFTALLQLVLKVSQSQLVIHPLIHHFLQPCQIPHTRLTHLRIR